MMAGHSLGEITALTAAGAVSFEDGLRLVRARGQAMKAAGEQNPGAMAALLGIDVEKAEALCRSIADEQGGVAVVANDNCPGQVVISGSEAAITELITQAPAHGAKRAVRLAVSIAAHSPLMQPAAESFREALSQVQWSTPEVTVYGNVAALPLDVRALEDELINQLTNRVRWRETVRNMNAAGTQQFVEIGSRDVLTGLLRRIDRNVRGIAVNSPDTLATFAREVA
jgi:[acyl-carrier-protein] S-malonyltransferase